MKYDGNKRSMAAARTAHFQSGKTPAMWLGRPVRMKDGKKEANRKACRTKSYE